MNLDGILQRLHVAESGCWLWTGARTKNGYGNVVFDGRNQSTHRVVYSELVAPVPPGKFLDHACHDPRTCSGRACEHRLCCNPAHLQVVTNRENSAPERSSHPNAWRDGVCARGHDVTDPANVEVNGRGSRRCRQCAKQFWRKPRLVGPQRKRVRPPNPVDEAARQQPCGHCGADAGARCVSASGLVMSRVHSVRAGEHVCVVTAP